MPVGLTDTSHRRVDVPGTSTIAGCNVASARVRAVTGREELLVSDALAESSGVDLANELLGRCVATITLTDGSDLEAGPVLGDLSVGDREVLLLRIRRISFGDPVDLVVSCADPVCSAPMDLRVGLDELCRASTASGGERIARLGGRRSAADERPSQFDVHFRLPTGADVAAVADIALDDPDRAGREVARACVVGLRVVSEGDSDMDIRLVGASVPDAGLDDEALEELGAVLARNDPHADIELALCCPECGHEFVAPLDAAAVLRDELLGRRRDLDVEVHLLAFHYRWTEAAILDLPSDRRRRYVDILGDALSRSTVRD